MRSPRAAAKARRREVLCRLADFGLAAAPCRVGRGPDPAASRSHERRLRAALESLGPVFSAFGAYLATRADLLPPGYGAGLADLPRGGPAAPAAVIREMVARELGRMSVVTFTAFEEEPYEIGLLYQVHRAVLTDGRPVVVKLAPPGLDEDIARDLDTLPLLRAVLAGVPEAAVPLDGLIAEFRQSVRQQGDCLRDAKVLEAVAQDLGEYEGLGVPRVHRRLCTGRMVTLERLPGRGLAAGHGGPGLASLLCTAWLQQALFGRFFPAEADPNSVAVLPDGRLAFGGPFASVPPSARKDFWEYLLAVSADHPDAACAHLVRLLGGQPDPDRETALRHSFRRAVPSRDGGSGSFEGGDRLVHLLLQHWRLALEEGCRPTAGVGRLFRALFQLEATATGLDPRRDALRDGLETVRMVAAFGRVRELMSPGHLLSNVRRYAAVIPDLPQRLDEVLTAAAEGCTPLHLRVRESGNRRGLASGDTVTAIMLLALAAVALVGQHLTHTGSLDGWMAKTGGVLILAAGGFLLGRLCGAR